jgi:hypothetical protein
MAVEHPSKDEVRGGDRRVDGVAEKVVEIENAEALATDRLQWMQKDRQIEAFNPRQNGLEHGIVEIVAVDVGDPVDAAQARLPGNAIELIDGTVWVKHIGGLANTTQRAG